MKQNTIKNTIYFNGTGLHCGKTVNVAIKPALANTGIVFKRIDINNKKNEVKATYNSVINTNLGTTIGKHNIFQKLASKFLLNFGIMREYGVAIRTIEHFMASLWACNIDNAIIEIDNKEIPIMDGSSDLFIKEILKAEIQELQEARKYLIVKKIVEIKDGDRFIRISPSNNYRIDLSIEFNYGNIGSQSFTFNGDQKEFMEVLSKARTFCNIKDVKFMQKHNLALGGSEDNAMIFDDTQILNKSGYRYDCEPVRHKLLDCVGDMFTSGYFMNCHIEASKTGHTLNNKILKKLFSSEDNYEIR